jgi:hypothetical protein
VLFFLKKEEAKKTSPRRGLACRAKQRSAGGGTGLQSREE